MSTSSSSSRVTLVAIPSYLLLKIGLGVAILKFSAQFLTPESFTVFSQLFFFAALLNMVSAGGLQIGLIREIAAAKSAEHANAIMGDALLVCTGFGILTLAMVFVVEVPLSYLLVGIDGYGGATVGIALLTVIAGPGQVFTAVLTGRREAAAGLFAQSVGLLAGGAVTLIALRYGRPVAAVIGYAGGTLLTTLIAAWLARGSLAGLRAAGIRIAGGIALLRYSAVYVVTAALFPTALFGIRYLYRDTFGTEQLADWLVANRVSDTLTQILALFMAQSFLPAFSAERNTLAARRIIRHNFLVALAVMTSFPVIFFVGSPILIPLLLSKTYLAATPKIAVYLVGDVLRVATSLALHAALARGRLTWYLGIEAINVAIFGGVSAMLIAMQVSWAPYYAYCISHGLIAAAVLVVYVRGRTAYAKEWPLGVIASPSENA
jgi:O-antigen/teichoic acid export membrane protein